MARDWRLSWRREILVPAHYRQRPHTTCQTQALSCARLTLELASRNPGARTLPPASADLESRSVFYRHFNPSSPKWLFCHKILHWFPCTKFAGLTCQCCHLTFVGESVLNQKMAWPNKRKKLKVILAILMILRRRRKSRYNASCRKMWEKTWIQRRGQLGIYHTLVQEIALEDAVCYKQYFRMSQQLFRAILEKIAPAITKQTTKLRRPISAAERLAITLRFLATGTELVVEPSCDNNSWWQFARNLLLQSPLLSWPRSYENFYSPQNKFWNHMTRERHLIGYSLNSNSNF